MEQAIALATFEKNIGYVKKNLEEYKTLVRDPDHVCRKCGRAAARKNNLCKPEKL